jgi:hypothetical protein
MTCRGHAVMAPISYACPRCGACFRPGELRMILPKLPHLACCCCWCGHHGPLLAFARAGVAA